MYKVTLGSITVIIMGVLMLALSACEKYRASSPKQASNPSSVEEIANSMGIEQAWLVDDNNKLILVDIKTGTIIPSCAEREKLKGPLAEMYPPCKARIKCSPQPDSGTSSSMPECILVDARTNEPFPAERIISREPYFEWAYQGSECTNQGGTQGDTEICCPPHQKRACRKRRSR